MLLETTIAPANYCCCHQLNGIQKNTSAWFWNSQSQLALIVLGLQKSCRPHICHDWLVPASTIATSQRFICGYLAQDAFLTDTQCSFLACVQPHFSNQTRQVNQHLSSWILLSQKYLFFSNSGSVDKCLNPEWSKQTQFDPQVDFVSQQHRAAVFVLMPSSSGFENSPFFGRSFSVSTNSIQKIIFERQHAMENTYFVQKIKC